MGRSAKIRARRRRRTNYQPFRRSVKEEVLSLAESRALLEALTTARPPSPERVRLMAPKKAPPITKRRHRELLAGHMARQKRKQ